MKLWRRQYTLRTFGTQKTRKGYVSMKEHIDNPVMLDVQPDTGTQLQVTAEGARKTMRIFSYGDFPVKTADQRTGIRADMLFYDGRWYECESSVYHSNTPLAHYKSTFLLVPESANTTDVDEPAAPATEAVGGEDE